MKSFQRAAVVMCQSVLLAAVPVAAGTHAGAGAETASASASSSSSDGDHRAPTVKSVFRRYGGGRVRQDAWNQTVRIAFRGRSGDVVGARTEADLSSGDDGLECQQVRLATRADDLVRQARSDFWTLPRRGRYVLTYTQDCLLGENTSGDSYEVAHRQALSVQLLKVRTHRLVPGKGVLTLPVDRAYVDVAELRLSGQRRVEIRAAAYPEQGKLAGEFDRIVTPRSTAPVREVGQVVDGDECFEQAPVTIARGRRLTGSTIYVGADGPYPVATQLWCNRDSSQHVAERGDTFWFFNEERPLEVEVVRLR